ncbi:ectonucleotide pyrophosphatase/phosphodiesterase [Pseudoxanthomonas sp. F37]|uniref:alkaline phosphatase family protein n=1 Tax=Pseudoxanthomonas TaxID=83618 RepID=UPI001FD08725|nr:MULTISPECIES: ectonucleotide pyrophosphatase/phosphodiesterase [Pseudoxanthomonas]UOV06223.1 ectonucleotide pyrophosphatase/phosphodiesterase [Pseudoxanthomonas mexicana]UOV07811.1 ectonucleotide pyrophosphatase/phosphodiesterase [Pseudoxanthomonas sp. F37]
MRSTLLLLALALFLGGCNSRPDTRPSRTPHSVVLISIDGLPARALQHGNTPHLDALAAEGVRAAWMNPSYPVLTFPNHFTLVTGLRPDRHGIIHNSMHDQAVGGFRVADKAAGADARWWQGEPIWNTAEKAGLRTAIWAWPGNAAPIGGRRPTRWVPYSPEVSAADRADQVAGWLIEPTATRPSLAALYFERVDNVGHDKGPDAPETQAAIREVDAAVGRIVQTLEARGLRATTDVVVVSDHGMAPVRPEQYIALEDMATIEQAEAVSTGQVIGFNPRPGHEADVEQRLLGRHDHYQCWRKQDLPARWHYGTHPRVPAIVCQFDEGWNGLPAAQLRRTPRAQLNRGSHGYDNALPSMRAVFIAAGPSFRRGATLPAFDNVDVYPLLAELLGLAPARNDGTADTFKPVLMPRTAPAH